MWKRFILVLILTLLSEGKYIWANDGIPFFTNYFPTSYHAHNRNFDIVGDQSGRIYVANFEGLLYYDQAEWHVLHAPGIFRFTKLYKDKSGTIWFGGYNLFGYLSAAENGNLRLNTIFSKENKGFLGEVTDISEENGKICVESSIGTTGLEDDSMADFVVRKSVEREKAQYKGLKINQRIKLADRSELLATAGHGFIKLNADGSESFLLSEQNGLCNNNVNAIYTDSIGSVWGATDEGVFLVNVNSTYMRFGISEGLIGEVQSICKTEEDLFVGTLRGLFRKEGKTFRKIENITTACWQLVKLGDGSVYACTAQGLFVVEGMKAKPITNTHTLSMFLRKNGDVFTGETDGVYLVKKSGERLMLNTIEKATHFLMEGDSALWVRNIYGQIFRCTGDMSTLNPVPVVDANGKSESFNNMLFEQNGVIYFVSHIGLFKWDSKEQKQIAVTASGDDRILASEYPQLVYPDPNFGVWSTDNEGKKIRVFSRIHDVEVVNKLIYPIHSRKIRTMEVSGKDVWFGDNFGIMHWNSALVESDYEREPSLFVRRVVMNGDSVIWGGFNQEDQLKPTLAKTKYVFAHDVREIRIEYSCDMHSSLGAFEYAYRLGKSDDWSDWSVGNAATFANPRPGNYSFEVKARDRYGRELAPVQVGITVNYPIYLRWYCLLLYVILLVVFIAVFIKWRMRRLLKEKRRLEEIVENRTSQIRKQKDEIEEKSIHLEKALDDLNKAQFELIRQEKMATVGTLTQGLVDRILNPMNYVNNFSHLSLSLLKDLQDNIEDDRENIDLDNYEDSIDVIDMLNTNMKKIEEHGCNTTRILKAMEEMLKEHTGKMVVQDIVSICRKNMEMLHSYHEKEIADYHIQLEESQENESIEVELDAEQFSRTIMSLLVNSIYAIGKKYTKQPFDSVIRLNVNTEGDFVQISIYDNGIGIEDTIKEKVFDPFFTTKTTAEGVGVGLYMSREVILNHGGTMEVKSTKNEYTEFIIKLPLRQLDRK